jgi:predicted GIY-YIG superfamily endonuclease
MSFFVYLLLSSDNCTYVGVTVNLDRHLRQHNKEIKGGAQMTGTKVEKGETWITACHVE